MATKILQGGPFWKREVFHFLPRQIMREYTPYILLHLKHRESIDVTLVLGDDAI